MINTYIESKIHQLNKPCVIGINGAITSGKTTFSEALIAYLNDRGYKTQLLHIDDFHNSRAVRMKDNSPEHYYANAVDTARFTELIAEIKRAPVNKTIAVRNMGTDDFTDTITLSTDMETVVIVEGVLLYIPQIRDLFDYKILLDIGYDEIIRRGLERDVPLYGEEIMSLYTDLLIPVQQIYADRCAIYDLCDMIIDNTDFLNPRRIE
jgi:Uridine kinase